MAKSSGMKNAPSTTRKPSGGGRSNAPFKGGSKAGGASKGGATKK